MHVNIGAPNAEDLKQSKVFWAAYNGEWYLVCHAYPDADYCDIVRAINQCSFPIFFRDMKKWAHCEGPVESASVDD